MSRLRCFLAVELPAQLQQSIQSGTSRLREEIGTKLVKWIPIEKIHLTLKFLGDVGPASLADVQSVLEGEVPRFAAFEAQVDGFGAFPNLNRPRVLWIGVTAPTTLAALQHELDMATQRLGFASEDRAFSPHLTIGRTAPNCSQADMRRIGEAVERTEVKRLGSLRINAVHLYKSELTPRGSIYSQICSVELIRGNTREAETHSATRDSTS